MKYLLFLFFVSTLCDFIDNNGVIYDDMTLTKLIGTTANLIKLILPIDTEIIGGGTTDTEQSKSALYLCKDSLEELIFPEGSKLREIEAYGCGFLSKVQKIDMSECKEIKILKQGAFFQCLCSEFIMPPNIESIQTGAFFGMKNIQEIIFPISLKNISGWSLYGNGVFSNCAKLENITFLEPSSITSIGTTCFSYTNISIFCIPSTLESIDTDIFQGCPLVSIDVNPLNQHFTFDSPALFNKDRSVIILMLSSETGTYKIPETVRTIGKGSFANCNFNTVEFTSNIATIEKEAFLWARITHITIPSTVKSVSTRTFGYCGQLETCDFQADIKMIEFGTFINCTNLRSFVVPSKIRTIGRQAFEGCLSIQRIDIPASVTNIQSKAFYNINNSCIINFDPSCPLRVENNTVFSSGFVRIIQYIGADSDFEVYIKSTVKTVDISAFAGFAVSSIVFEDKSSLESICDKSFQGCSLLEVAIPDSVTLIGESAFANNKDLYLIIFGKGIENIGNDAFVGTSLVEVKLNEKVKSIGERCFSINSLETVVCQSAEMINNLAFAGSKVKEFVVPANCVSLGEDIFNGSKLQMLMFRGPSSLSRIGDYSLRGYETLEWIEFCDGIRAIGRGSFEGCTKLSSVLIGQDIENLSSYCFRGCTELKKVRISFQSSLERIEEFVFYGCIQLSSFEISPSHEKFEAEGGVLYTRGKKRIVVYLPGSPDKRYDVPEGIESIDAFAFAGAQFLEEIGMMMSAVSNIGYGAFMGCPRLRRIEIPEGTDSVGQSAFADCPMLQCGSIVYGEEKFEMLKEAGAPLEALRECITESFDIVEVNSKLIALILSETDE